MSSGSAPGCGSRCGPRSGTGCPGSTVTGSPSRRCCRNWRTSPLPGQTSSLWSIWRITCGRRSNGGGSGGCGEGVTGARCARKLPFWSFGLVFVSQRLWHAFEGMTAPVNGGAAPGLDFTIEIDATRDLGADVFRAEALITVTAHPAGAAAPAAAAVEVLIMDRSRSMMGANKIHEAHRAACAAIDALPDGVLLGIIAGNRTAEPVFPAAGGLAVIDAGTRAAAKRQVMSLRPEGGTEIGRSVAPPGELFAAAPAAGFVRHAVLYTDGKNEHETPAALDA